MKSIFVRAGVCVVLSISPEEKERRKEERKLVAAKEAFENLDQNHDERHAFEHICFLSYSLVLFADRNSAF